MIVFINNNDNNNIVLVRSTDFIIIVITIINIRVAFINLNDSDWIVNYFHPMQWYLLYKIYNNGNNNPKYIDKKY